MAFVLHILSAWSSFLGQADIFFLPCPFKYLTGVDCPGCGFQRSLLALLQGDLSRSLHLYPATIPLLVTFGTAWPAKKLIPENWELLIKMLYIITGSVILISYLIKLFTGHVHG